MRRSEAGRRAVSTADPCHGGSPTLARVAGTGDDLRRLLEAVRSNDVPIDEALEHVASLSYRDLGFARLDVQRKSRQGAPEAALAEGKTPEQVTAIVEAMVQSGVGSVLVTRADESVRAAVHVVVVAGMDGALASVIGGCHGSSRGRRAALHVRIEDSERAHRDPHEVRDLVESADLPEQIKSGAVDALRRLAEVEARIHGVAVEEVHFHDSAP